MKWRVKYMVDPGDGIVTEKEIESSSDDICGIASDIMNGDSELGEFYEYWLMGLEAIPE